MFFDKLSDIKSIASKCGTSLFVVPNDAKVDIPNAIILAPEEKSVITIDQVRKLFLQLGTKQLRDQFVIIRPAELLQREAANALLKNLEEPGDKVHFVLITDSLSLILPTILSRAEVYLLKQVFDVNSPIVVDEKIKDLAKKLMTAQGAELVDVVEEITKKKDGVRNYALTVLSTAIEMLYKSYFLTEKQVFVKKLPKYLAAYDAISKNGHIKLQLVANLM